MDCPYCDSKLEYKGQWCHSGNIYKCPKSEGFNTETAAREYSGEFFDDWKEIVCESSEHGGMFYTDDDGHLFDGLPVEI